MVLKFESDAFVSRKTPQVLASLAAAIGAFALGNVVAWTSPALPHLRVSEKFHSLTHDEISWIASLVPLGGVVSGPLAGFLMGKCGRQLSAFLLSFPFTIGWLLIAFAQNVTMMCLGRFITGLCGGAYCLIIPIYLSEISEESIRGVLSSAFATVCCLGVIFTYILGTFVSWQTLTIVSTCVPVIYAVAMYFTPESPIYLLSKGKRREAGESLIRLRGATEFYEVEPELFLMESSLGQNRRMKLTINDYFAADVLKPLTVSLVLMVLQQFAGINAVIFYTVDIFESAGSDIDPNLATIIVGLVFLLGNFLSAVFIDKTGRRPLLLISDAVMTICLLGLGVFFYLKSSNNDIAPEGLTWLPLASLMAYAVFFNFGVGPLGWIMMAEILPSHVKGGTSALATSFNWLLAFIVTKFFIQMSVAIGMSSCYFIFAGVCAFGTVFIYFIVPETNGKTLEEIQKHFL